ncbi:prepilin peptidase [Bacillus solimangrovi]|uniref:Prepilin leader peptidase/N-methyltransferase n=1 Tax=Bacillus solimangrovi TaxID=1305675 RepID=A0A1E5LBJ0_9BACI|nr:A24 family peptidase [Bacillus solimangrovi]OEH91456.1 prepilin peptidase [Bacillus solimangrovi]
MNLLLLILGITLGSFFNVVGLRVPMNQSIVTPRSACPSCKRTLTARELIPVISYIIQRGKCRNCSMKISPLYPLVEMATGVLFAVSPLLLGWSKELVIAWLLISLLMIIFVSDLTYMIIPDKVLICFAVIFLLLRVFWIPTIPWWSAFLGSLIGFGLLFIIAIVSKGGMGGGDIKLYGVLGLALGWELVLLSFFFATFIGAIGGIIGMGFGYVKKGKPMPFGPAIVVGTLVAYFYGWDFFKWYHSLFL